jgi:hypothetical protein
MLRPLPLLALLAAAPALAASEPPVAAPVVVPEGPAYRHETAADGTILIVVAPEDLLECRITLAFVLMPLTLDEQGNPLPVAAGGAARPPAECVSAEG